MRECMEIGLQRDPCRNFEPSIGVLGPMRTVRYACIALLAALVFAAPASADEVLVLGKDGRARERDDRHLTATRMPRPRAGAVATAAQRKKKKRRTVAGELKRLRDTGLITPEDYAARRAFYDEVKRQARTLTGLRKTEMRGVLAAVEGIAARRQLTPSRLAPLWLTLQRNLEWWTTGPLLASGRRVEFQGSELVWQYYPGQGLQLQMLGNFGKLNGLWGTRANARLAVMLDELLPLAAERAGGLAWEYYFTFGGGRPPWVSGLAQGTAVQALARAATRLRRQADVLPIAQRALAVFETPAPEGVRVPAAGGRPLRDLLVRAPPAGAQRLRAGVERPARLRAPVRRPARRRAVRGGRAGGARSRSRPTTPAPGRCIRAAARCASPTSATTTS